MEYVIKKDIISILRKAIQIIKQEDIPALDELSNHTIHNASIFQDKDSIKIAVIIYALSKIIHRSEQITDEWDKAKEMILGDFKKARFFLETNKEENYRELTKQILSNVGKIDTKLKLYVEDVLEKAKIVKGSKLYEHGISVEKAADMLGISQWDLLSYIGKTQIIDRYEEEVIPITKRLDYAKSLFNV